MALVMTAGAASVVFDGALVDAVGGATTGSAELAVDGVFSCAVCCCAADGEDTVAPPPQPAVASKMAVAITDEFNRHRREYLFTFIEIHNPMGSRQSNQQNRIHPLAKEARPSLIRSVQSGGNLSLFCVVVYL